MLEVIQKFSTPLLQKFSFRPQTKIIKINFNLFSATLKFSKNFITPTKIIIILEIFQTQL